MQRQMADVMKKMGKGGMLKQAMKQMFGKGGAPDPSQMDAEAMRAAAQQLQGRMPGMGGIPGMGGGMNLPGGLSGLGFGKKK